MPISEFLMSVDDFQNPKVIKNTDAVSTLLIRLLLLEPGMLQSHPDAGVGLISRFRYSVETEAPNLQSEFQKQIEKYLPQFQGATISVKVKNQTFIIGVQIDEAIYGIYYNTETSEITSNHTDLLDL